MLLAPSSQGEAGESERLQSGWLCVAGGSAGRAEHEAEALDDLCHETMHVPGWTWLPGIKGGATPGIPLGTRRPACCGWRGVGGAWACGALHRRCSCPCVPSRGGGQEVAGRLSGSALPNVPDFRARYCTHIMESSEWNQAASSSRDNPPRATLAFSAGGTLTKHSTHSRYLAPVFGCLISAPARPSVGAQASNRHRPAGARSARRSLCVGFR